MSYLIEELRQTFGLFLYGNNVDLNERQKEELNDIFSKIKEHFLKKTQWCAPELLQQKAIISIYKFLPYINDIVLNENLRIYWNRFLTRLYLRNDFKFSDFDNKMKFFENYSKKIFESHYEGEKVINNLNYFKSKMKELQDNFPNSKPLIVKLIEDDNYNFITLSEFKIYLIRSNNIITSHENIKCFDNNCIDFYDELVGKICNKGLIFAFV